MWKKIDQFVKQYQLIEKGDHLLVGLSGGADSILLTRYLLSLRESSQIDLCAVHVNHLLRGQEAARDEKFVEEFCRRWEIPCFIFQEDVAAYGQEHKMTLEEAGREVRYACFEKVMKQEGCNKIAIAHHANDLAETMIFRMIRGTGPEGLSGIHPKNKNRVRPLLCVDKKEILWILKALEESYVDDSTNDDVDYSRNYIRHHIIPAMDQVNEKAVDHMGQLSRQLLEQSAYIEEKMDQLFADYILMEDGCVKMRLGDLEHFRSFEKKEMIRRMIYSAGGHRKDIGAVHVDMVWDLLENVCGRQYDLPYGLLAVKEKEFLTIKRRTLPKDVKEIMIPINRLLFEEKKEVMIPVDGGREVQFHLMEISQENLGQFLKNDCVKYFDYDKINSTLCIRTRRNGDYFVMDRSGKRKKLNRYFIDQKIAEPERDQKLVLAQENHILWIEGGRISEHFKIGQTTRRVLKLSLKQSER